MSTKTKTLSMILTVLFVACMAAACSLLPQVTKSSADPTALPTVISGGGATAEGKVMPRDDAWLSFKVSGNVSEVIVKEGDRVTRGAVLARLGDREKYAAAVTAAKLEQTNAQQALDDLKKNAETSTQNAKVDLINAQKAVDNAQKSYDAADTDSYRDDLSNAQSDLAKRQDELKKKQEEFDKYKNLSIDNRTRKDAENALRTARKDFDNAQIKVNDTFNRLESPRISLAAAQARLKYLTDRFNARKNGVDADTFNSAQARLDNANAQLASAQAALDDLDLKAPFDGTVVRVSLSANTPVFPNQAVIQVADLSKLYVETDDLTEKNVAKLSEGQSAVLTADALPGLEMTGKIESIAQYFIEKSGDINYTVRILISNPDPKLRWGMTVKVEFAK